MQREKWRVKFVEFIYRCREIFHHKAVDNSSIVYYRRDIAKKLRDILPIDSWKLAIVAATTVTTSFSINICHNKLFLSDRSVEKKNSWLCVKFIQTYCVCNGLSASLCVHGCWSAVELRRVDNITYTRGTHRVLRRLLQSNHNEVTREKMEKKQQQSTTHIKYTTIWRIL